MSNSDIEWNGTGGPRCPNHRVTLTDCQKGKGICPISGCVFEYDADAESKEKKLKINALGQMEATTDWDVQGEEK